jgi:hypothetical protein
MTLQEFYINKNKSKRFTAFYFFSLVGTMIYALGDTSYLHLDSIVSIVIIILSYFLYFKFQFVSEEEKDLSLTDIVKKYYNFDAIWEKEKIVGYIYLFIIIKTIMHSFFGALGIALFSFLFIQSFL